MLHAESTVVAVSFIVLPCQLTSFAMDCVVTILSQETQATFTIVAHEKKDILCMNNVLHRSPCTINYLLIDDLPDSPLIEPYPIEFQYMWRFFVFIRSCNLKCVYTFEEYPFSFFALQAAKSGLACLHTFFCVIKHDCEKLGFTSKSPLDRSKMDFCKEYVCKNADKHITSIDSIGGYSKIIGRNSVFQQPLISICIAHYNHGEYLQQALDSLRKQKYVNYEVIVVDDGSTEVASQKIFRSLSQHYPPAQFSFYFKDNTGVGHTRNYAAHRAKGDYLLFFDSDNIALPQMLSTFVRAIQTAHVDVVTCPHLEFSGKNPPDLPSRIYVPLGAALVPACLENVLGDTTALWKKEVFWKIGGFGEKSTDLVEDWALLVRCLLSHNSSCSVPEPLFWYRIMPQSRDRSIDNFAKISTILDIYREYAPKPYVEILPLLAVRMQYHEYSYSIFVQYSIKIGIWLETWYAQFFQHGTVQQKCMSTLRRLFSTLR